MKKYYLFGITFIILVASFLVAAGRFSQSTDDQVEALLTKMTLEEKVGQMAQLTLDVIAKGDDKFVSDEPLQLDMEKVRKAIVDYKVGSILNTANNRARTVEKWNEVIGQIQKMAIDETRLGIPVIYGIDAIHGTTYTAGATLFPQQISMAASWNRELVRKGAEITAYETRASGIPWNFSPVLDLGRDPRFPRMWETFGEDVFLATELGKEMIKGYEGETNDVSNPTKVASTMKHFLGYSVPNSGKDRTPAFIPEIELRERHLPAFKAAIDAGAHSLMVNSGLINGVSVHSNKKLLTTLLREELGFTGVIVSDWRDIDNLYYRDRVASSRKEAVKLAINAGIDISMIPYDYAFCDYLVELVNEGEVPMERINDAVRRILTLKVQLGLFENPVTLGKDYPLFGSKEFENAAFQGAAESITLLKNDGVLPLKAGTKILITGPNANSMRSLNGGWSYSWQGEKVSEFAETYNTILEAVEKTAGKDNVQFLPGVTYDEAGKYWEEKPVDLAKVAVAAKRADVILLCLGENSYTEKPGDLHDLSLSPLQLELARTAISTGKPVILVLNEGRPRLIGAIEKDMKAVIQTYLPGNFGGDALAQILFGDVNPSGRLPYTYPLFSNTLVTYDHKYAEEQDKMEGAYDYESDFAIQYPFGHGLSYTTFEYSDLKVSNNTMSPDDGITISVSVKNTGQRTGKEVVQLFVSDLFASVAPDMKRLRGFKKISLTPGESKVVTFTIAARDLAFIGRDHSWTVEKGTYQISIASLTREIEITATKSYNTVIQIL